MVMVSTPVCLLSRGQPQPSRVNKGWHCQGSTGYISQMTCIPTGCIDELLWDERRCVCADLFWLWVITVSHLAPFQMSDLLYVSGFQAFLSDVPTQPCEKSADSSANIYLYSSSNTFRRRRNVRRYIYQSTGLKYIYELHRLLENYFNHLSVILSICLAIYPSRVAAALLVWYIAVMHSQRVLQELWFNFLFQSCAVTQAFLEPPSNAETWVVSVPSWPSLVHL